MEPAILDILIFDMDGVLIDVSHSYRDAIRQTVQIYLESCLGFPKRGKKGWVTEEQISFFKSAGGFNNDWDLTSGLLLYLLSVSGLSHLPRRKRFSSILDLIAYLKIKSSQFRPITNVPLSSRELRPFLRKVNSRGGGLRGIRQILTGSWEGWVYHKGDLDQENLVKRIFQEVYLGRMFSSRYHLCSIFYNGEGLYLHERALIPGKILSTLRKMIRMGIASGRPRFEAELALKRLRLYPYFDSVVTLNECEAEENRILASTGKKISCSKPRPYAILKVVQEIGIPDPLCGYVGDVVDDMLAARAAKRNLQILAVGFIGSRRGRRNARKSLRRGGADLIVENPRQLLRLVSSPRQSANLGSRVRRR